MFKKHLFFYFTVSLIVNKEQKIDLKIKGVNNINLSKSIVTYLF